MTRNRKVNDENDHKRIRLLHILYGGMGGIGTYFLEFVTSDRHQRFTHQAVFYGIEAVYPEYRDFCRDNRIPVVAIRKRRGPDLIALARLAVAASDSTDAIIVHTVSGALPALLRRLLTETPVIHIEHTSQAAKTRRDRFWSLLLRRFSNRTVLFYAAQSKEWGVAAPLAQPNNRYVVVPKVADMRFFKPRSPKTDTEIRIGMLGRMSHVKDHATLIRAVAALRLESAPRISLHLAGDGPLRSSLEHLSSGLGISHRVNFYGTLGRHAVLDFMQNLDVYVHASSGETICYAVMEAQACGLPIIASDVPGIRDALGHGAMGLLFPHQDSSALSAQLETLIMSAEERSRFGDASLAVVQERLGDSSTAESFYATICSVRDSTPQ